MTKRSLTEEIKDQRKRGVLLVLTGPTGAGKDALFAKLLARNNHITRVITTTSRGMRPNEKEDDPYHFIDRLQFEKLIADGQFFEWVEFREHLYGTQRKTLEEALRTGTDVIWHIDARGVKNIRTKVKEMYPRSVFIFLTAPTEAELEARVKRDEATGVMHHRWNPSLVAWEMEQYDDCDYLVVNENDELDETVEKVLAIMTAKRLEILR